MAPRDRDTARGRYPDPQWDEYADDSEYSEEFSEAESYSDEDLPGWTGDEDLADRPGSSSRQPQFGYQPEQQTPRRRPITSPLPELSRNLQRPAQSTGQRRPSTRPSQPRQPTSYEDQVEEEWQSETAWEDEQAGYQEEHIDEYGYGTAPRRRGRAAGRSRGRPRPPRRPPSMPPALVAAVSAQDRSSIYLLGTAALSVFFMSLLIMTRSGDLPGMIPIHLDAAGSPDLWGTPSTLWRIVLAAVMITFMNSIAAWFLAPRDPFIARFLIGSSLLAHVLAWIALFLLLW